MFVVVDCYLRFFTLVFSGMLSHGHLFHVPVIRHFRTIWLITPTQISSEGQESWNKFWYRKICPKKTRKTTTKNCPRFRRLCPDYSWKIHAISLTINSERYITWNTRNIPVNLRSLMILNYMKQIEGRGRLKEGVQYYFINIVLSVKLKKIIIEKSLVISLFSSEFTLIYLYLPWKNKRKCNDIMHANVRFFSAQM